jgi:outer membrane receptor for ferrienterochelin and colicin
MENFEDDISIEGKLVLGNFRFGLIHQDKRTSRTTSFKTIGSNYKDSDSLWHITFTNLWGRHNLEISDTTSLDSLVYYRDATVPDDTVGEIDTTGAGSQHGYYRPNWQLGLEEKLNYRPFESLDMIIGYNWERETLAQSFSRTNSASIDAPPPPLPDPPMTDTYLSSLFAQAQYWFTDTTSISAGFRRDHSSVYDWITTPRMGLVHTDGAFTAKLLYSEAFRAPKPWDIANSVGSLNPEEVASREAYVGYQINNNWKVDASLYRNKIEDRLVSLGGGKFTNRGSQVTDGLELGIEYRKDRTRAYANYTFTDSVDDTGSQVPEIARHGMNLGVTWPLSEKLELDLRGQYLGKRQNLVVIPTTGSRTVDDAWVVHSALNWRHNKWFAQLALNNLFDEEYYHTSNRPPERYRQPQRQLMLTLRYDF